MAPRLSMRGICKRFPGVVALDDISIEAPGGEVLALVGENGAGKSTLIKILAGAIKRDAGEIFIDGQPVSIRDPHHSQSLGIGVIHQELHLVPAMCIAENIWLGDEPLGRACRINRGTMHARARDWLEKLGVDLDPATPVRQLSIAEKQMVEIAKALHRQARILIMDEPTATLSVAETQRLFRVMADLKAQGVAIVYVSHRMEEIFALADRVTVLRDGRHVASQPLKGLDQAGLIRQMVGREVREFFDRSALMESELGPVALEARGLCTKKLRGVDLVLREGEIVGLGGLMGAGRTEVARALFGADRLAGGEILFGGRKVRIGSPRDAIRLGIALATEDRKSEGLILKLPVGSNIILANLKVALRGWWISRKREKQVAGGYVDSLRIRTHSIDQKVVHLSGGNQQKVVLAKWLNANPQVMIFDEPTRGIDVGAKTEIYHLIHQLKRQGKAILVISSDLPELLELSDRVVVMALGRVAGELSRTQATAETVMALATGGNGL
jgi:ABC-type sugar transport system ATPase subunit